MKKQWCDHCSDETEFGGMWCKKCRWWNTDSFLKSNKTELASIANYVSSSLRQMFQETRKTKIKKLNKYVKQQFIDDYGFIGGVLDEMSDEEKT